MRASTATFPAFGVDTVMSLDTQACRFLVREGFHFAVRYLGGMSRVEFERILCSGLAVMPVTYSRGAGWVPSFELGCYDAEKAIARLKELKMPHGVTVWLDLEGCDSTANKTKLWINAWSLAIRKANYEAGLYVGANPGGMDSESLWKLPFVNRYWRSCSNVPEPASRGWCMQQLKPWNHKLGSLTVDIDVIESDYKGDRPTWAIE